MTMLWVVGTAATLIGALVVISLATRYLRLPAVLRRISIDQWRAIDAETERDPGDAGRASVDVLIVLITVAVALTLQEYIGEHETFTRLFPRDGSRYWDLQYYAWWSGWRLVGYV